ncbi:MAG: methylmalonyl-CoA mutase family protein [Deltaproteobacteria bacterium]|nr:methylmalonyl-CoA mutase family protein [Deltaproteobacteria bacterium]
MSREKADNLQKAKEKWRAGVLEPFLKKTGERKQRFYTTGGAPVDTCYFPGDEQDYSACLGFPGAYPFTRGVYPNMYRGRLWTMRQYAGFGDAEQSNKWFHYLLAQGQTGLSIAFDLCTQIGYDSDHEMSAGEVGRVGVAIDSLRDMELLFEGIPLDEVSTSMTINATAAVLLAMVMAVAEKQRVPWEKLRGTVQNDILKEYIARGTYIYPPAPSLRLVTDLITFCSRNLPEWNTISISGYHIREAGSTASQEVGFTIADGIAYVQAALDAGNDVDLLARRLSFFFAAHNDLFEEVAKYRAARRLWAKTMRNRFGVTHPESMMLRFHTQTAGCALSAQQPENNIVRVTVQALAATAGGTQSLHTNSYDEALALPSQQAATIALRTQQILAHESGIANTVDPFGGSYYVEALTDRIEKQAEQYVDKIDKLGGVLMAIERGYIQREIQEASYEYQASIERGERLIVGVNAFCGAQSVKPRLLKVDETVEQRQIERTRAVRAERNQAEAEGSLERLEHAARSDGNLMLPILDAVRAYCTIGEISDVLRKVFGEYRDRRI